MTKPALLVCEITPTWDEAYDPPEFFGNVISYRPATPAEVLAEARRLVDYLRPAQMIATDDGYDWDDLTDAAKDSLLVRAADYVDAALGVEAEE